MNRKTRIFNYSTDCNKSQYIVKKRVFVGAIFVWMVYGMAVYGMTVSRAQAISEVQKHSIIDHCSLIRESLKNLQKSDARARVYLGRSFEAILSKYMIPLNVRLVENNISNPALMENQTNFAEQKAVFSNDFISYQQTLEELINIDCKNDSDRFYEYLGKVRGKRKTVEDDVNKMQGLISEHQRLVSTLKEELK